MSHIIRYIRFDYYNLYIIYILKCTNIPIQILYYTDMLSLLRLKEGIFINF